MNYTRLVSKEMGELHNASIAIKRAVRTEPNPIAGVISTNPEIILGPKGVGQQPVALSGRVPVKFSDENGAVAVGDRIAVSSTAGVGMKAGPFDDSVGIVIGELEHHEEGPDTVMIFLDLHQGIDINSIALGLLGADAFTVFGSGAASSTAAAATSTSNTPLDFVGGVMNAFASRIGSFTFFATTSTTATSTVATSTEATSTPHSADAYVTNLMRALFSSITQWLADSTNGIVNFFASIGNFHKVNTDELCVGSVCVTEADFMAIFGAAASASPPTSVPSSPSISIELEPAADPPISVSSSTPETTLDFTNSEQPPPEFSTSTPVELESDSNALVEVDEPEPTTDTTGAAAEAISESPVPNAPVPTPANDNSTPQAANDNPPPPTEATGT